MSTPNRIRLVALILVVWLTAGGCHRGFYRDQADRQVECIVDNTQFDAGPAASQMPFSIEIDPRSRMFDPFCKDFPPMPHDDPAAHQYMHCVDGHRGYPRWHRDGDTAWVENPLWPLCDPCGAEELVLDADTAMAVAWINSRDYQMQLENVYLAALDVSFEEFRFDTQFFGGIDSFFTSIGPEGPGGPSNEYRIDSDLQMNKLFATGGELMVGFANSLVWEFTGDNNQSSSTLLNFSFIQPLLRGGGRDVVLESLTQTQRDLLYDVRSLERYRNGFYVNLITGQSAGGASASPGGGYLGLLQTQQNIRNQEFSIAQLQSSLAQLEAFFDAGRIDFFQVEQARQSLFNSQSQLINLRAGYQDSLDSYKIALGLPPACRVRIEDPVIEQFNLVDLELLPAQTAITQLQLKVGDSVVGMLPIRELPTPPRNPQGALLRMTPHILRAVSMQNGGEDRFEQAEQELGTGAGIPDDAISDGDEELGGDVFELLPPGQAGQGANRPAEIVDIPGLAEVGPQIPWSDAVVSRLRELQGELEIIAALRDNLVNENVPRARADILRLISSLDTRLETADELRARLTAQLSTVEGSSSEPDPGILDVTELRELPGQLTQSLDKVEAYLESMPNDLAEQSAKIDALLEEGPNLQPGEVYQRLRDDVILPVPNAVSSLSEAVIELTLIQARARTESVVLVSIDLPAECALEIARANRRDWMNQRGMTVDAWRQIAVTANDLESGLDVTFSGDIRNVGDSPFNLQGETGSLRAGLAFDAPLTRLVERNVYRASLINFQQARRAQYAFEDSVSQSLRSILRTIEVSQLDFELQRTAVLVAIQQVELTQLRLQEPPQPGQTQSQASPTTSRDLIDAIAGLLTAQNRFLQVWVSYESLRRQLDFEMGTMELDSEGVWIDPGEIDDSICPPTMQCPCEPEYPELTDYAAGVSHEESGGGPQGRNSVQPAVFHEEEPRVRTSRRTPRPGVLELRR